MNISREALPAPVLAPQSSYPQTNTPCLGLEENEDQQILFEIKKNFTSCMKNSRFYHDMDQVSRGIERYSDKYSKVLEPGSSDGNSIEMFGEFCYYCLGYFCN